MGEKKSRVAGDNLIFPFDGSERLTNVSIMLNDYEILARIQSSRESTKMNNSFRL